MLSASTAADVLAIGDGRNDIEMLRWAGRGVAMGQAVQEVHDAADASTGDVYEDGAAAELRPLVSRRARGALLNPRVPLSLTSRGLEPSG